MEDTLNMNTADADALAHDGYRQMVDYLENILTRQLERVRNYDLDNAMLLAEEANNLAVALAQAKTLDTPEFADERWRITKLYKDIGLIIAAERQEVSEKLGAIRKGIRTLGLYADSV